MLIVHNSTALQVYILIITMYSKLLTLVKNLMTILVKIFLSYLEITLRFKITKLCSRCKACVKNPTRLAPEQELQSRSGAATIFNTGGINTVFSMGEYLTEHILLKNKLGNLIRPVRRMGHNFCKEIH